jgi:hypothetical protein
MAMTTAQEYQRIAKNWPRLEAYQKARPTMLLDITKALTLIAHNFIDPDADPDDLANVGSLAPGGHDATDDDEPLADAPRPQPAATRGNRGRMVARGKQTKEEPLTFTVSDPQFFAKVDVVAVAWGITADTHGGRIGAIVQRAYDEVRQEQQEVAGEDDPADRSQPIA